MKIPDGEIVVTDIAARHVSLYLSKSCLESELRQYGFIWSNNYLTMDISNDEERKSLVEFLIDLNSLFSAGRDWSPEEIVALYKEQGLTNQPYRVIAWTSPDKYVISTK